MDIIDLLQYQEREVCSVFLYFVCLCNTMVDIKHSFVHYLCLRVISSVSLLYHLSLVISSGISQQTKLKLKLSTLSSRHFPNLPLVRSLDPTVNFHDFITNSYRHCINTNDPL